MTKEGARATRVYIVGFDSLDYHLIEKYNLKFIKQEECGKIDMTQFIGYNRLLSTPTIWTSFITGLSPDQHKVVGWKWENPILDRLKTLGVKFGLGRMIVTSKHLRRPAMKIIKDKYVPNIKGKIPTIFDYAQRPVDIDVPCYSQDAYEEERRALTYGLGNPIVERQVADKAWKEFRDKKERVLEALRNDWDLFMAHFYLPDVIQHLLWYREDEIERLYREMDITAHDIGNRVGENGFVLFVSDHGAERGLHNPNAFYSCNQRIGLHNPQITDFANIIRQKLGVPSKTEIEQVRKRLQDLGYL